jgi:hypothetical protein
VFGDYGQGKSHLLKVIRAAAIREGWVVSFVEFDPKQADPAKPHLVYRAITGGLCFPTREDGSRSRDFFDLVGEARKSWDTVSMGPQFRMSPWFGPTLRALRFHSHSREDRDYVQAVEWLAGQPVGFAVVRGLCRAAGRSVAPPPLMPKTLETADIYVSHLVTIHEMCRALGYKGLLVILDEAEHIRGFNVNRRERANNLFDILARCAHLPRRTATGPFGNSHGVDVGRAWAQGPHFGLVVALTPGDMHVDDIDELKRSCVFVHDDRDVVRLRPPSVRDYMAWCQNYLSEYVTHYPGSRVVAGSPDVPRVLAGVLAEEYARQAEPERNIRLWGKMAAFCCALDMNESVGSLDQMTETLRRVARSAAGEIMPWEL